MTGTPGCPQSRIANVGRITITLAEKPSDYFLLDPKRGGLNLLMSMTSTRQEALPAELRVCCAALGLTINEGEKTVILGVEGVDDGESLIGEPRPRFFLAITAFGVPTPYTIDKLNDLSSVSSLCGGGCRWFGRFMAVGRVAFFPRLSVLWDEPRVS